MALEQLIGQILNKLSVGLNISTLLFVATFQCPFFFILLLGLLKQKATSVSDIGDFRR